MALKIIEDTQNYIKKLMQELAASDPPPYKIRQFQNRPRMSNVY